MDGSGLMMYSPPTPQTRLAETLHGARHVHYHQASGRLFVWRTGPVIDVVHVDSGEVLGHYPCDGTADSVVTTIAERINAGY